MLDQWILKHVKAICHPFSEMLASLHVLSAPDHHPKRLDWVEKTKKDLPDDLFLTLLSYGKHFNQYLGIMDFLATEAVTVEEGIDRLRMLGSEEFIDYLLAGKERKQLTQAQADLTRKPGALKRQFVDALYEYHQQVFAREWFRIEPWLIRATHGFNEHLQKHPLQTIRSVHPRFQINEQGLKFFKAQTWSFSYDEIKKVIIRPSTFIEPHLLVGEHLPNISVGYHVTVPGIEERPDFVPPDLLAVTKAMADGTRIKILREILYHPYCTAQLAEKYRIAEATVSKHLKILKDAGLARTERQGNFVFYHGVPERIDMLRVDIDQFFDQPLLDSKK